MAKRRLSNLAALGLLVGAVAGSAPTQSLSAPSEAGTTPTAETIVPSPPVKPAGEFSPQQRGAPWWFGAGRLQSASHSPLVSEQYAFLDRNDLRDGAKEFIVVDVERGIRQSAFDHPKLAGALSKACGQEFKAERLPFGEFEFIEEGKAIRVEAGGKNWRYDLNTFECSPITKSGAASRHPLPPLAEASRTEYAAAVEAVRSPALSPQAGTDASPATNRNAQSTPPAEKGNSRGGQPAEAEQGMRSPDGKWSAFVRGQNVFMRLLADGAESQLTQDGCEGNGYGMLEWAPDSSALVAWRIEPGDIKDVYLIQSSPPGGGRAVLHKRPYALPGDKFARYELSVLDPATRKQTKPQVDRFEHEWETPHLRWDRDGRHFAYVQVDRGHQRFRVIEVDARTGEVRNLMDERTRPSSGPPTRRT